MHVCKIMVKKKEANGLHNYFSTLMLHEKNCGHIIVIVNIMEVAN